MDLESTSSVGGVVMESPPLPIYSTLDRLPAGFQGIVGAPTTLNPTVLRLLEMGLTIGAPVSITRRAPGGDPIEILIRGTRLCLRLADARCFPVWHAASGLPQGKDA